jgi:hypothetical protein
MIVTYVRSSSYNNYAYCEMQYFITYVLGHQPSSGKKAELGTMAHKVMEVLAGLKKYQQDNTRAKILVVNDDALGEVKFPKKSLMSNETVDKLIGMSIEAYSQKSHHKFYKGDKEDVIIHHPEPHFDIPIEEDWAKFEYEIDGKKIQGQLAIKGTIDLVTLINDDTIEVIDWKTGRRMDWATGEEKDYKKLENDAQLLLYFYAISKLYPEFPNRIMSIFFYKNKEGDVDPAPFSLCFGPEDEKRFLEMLKERVTEIRNNVKPKPVDSTRTNFKCKYLCHYHKNNWPGTEDSMCIHIEKHLKKHGMEKTVEDCTREGFDIGYYSAPG